MTALDHLDLEESDRLLIEEAVGGAPTAYLAQLDKGLSGASVWKAQWELKGSRALSDLHVFKIGPSKKLKREYEAIMQVAAPIDSSVGVPFYFRNGGKSLLRQPFSGGDPHSIRSLKDFVRNAGSAEEAANTVRDLYRSRMEMWHSNEKRPSQTLTNQPYGEALDWWLSRVNISDAVELLGRNALETNLKEMHGVSIDDIESSAKSLMMTSDDFVIGPVHGDLHAQNVLIGAGGKIYLIDFGWCAERWRAIDFLMLECSLKYVVAPRHASVGSLLRLDGRIDEITKGRITPAIGWTNEVLYNEYLDKLAFSIAEIRMAALDFGAVKDHSQYRIGLFLLTLGLTSMPYRINHAFMFHSLADYISSTGS